MLDEQTVRDLALAFLQVEEHTHWQRPAFRVNNKIFATIWPLQQRVVIRLSPADQTQLIGQDSITFSAVEGKWGQQGYTISQYDKLSEEECHRLLRRSWLLVAPSS